MIKKFPIYKQLEQSDCGPACLQMISRYYGKSLSLVSIKKLCPMDRGGVTLKGLSMAAESIGFRTNGVKIPFRGNEDEGGLNEVNLPCIVFWKLRHFVVVYKIQKDNIWVADPAIGKVQYSKIEFEKNWLVEGNKGIALLLDPQPKFHLLEEEDSKQSFSKIYDYLKPHKKLLIQVLLGLFVSSIFSLIFPFLTQSIIDKGIFNHDLQLINLIVIAQIILFVSSTLVNAIQSWIFLNIGVRVSIELIHDFLIKVMRLPMTFFNTRTVGDLLQRIGDHDRVNSFITSSTVNAFFSIFNLFIFSIILLFYDLRIFTIYWISSTIYFLWIIAFLKKKKLLDYQFFEYAAANQSKLIEIFQGIQEIKLQNSERKRRWQWTNLQAKIFKLQNRSLLVTQFQTIGATVINQFRNIIISYLSAKAVFDGQLSLGVMLSIQYIIGMINAPLEAMILFLENGQSAKIGFDRLNEIHSMDNEVTNIEAGQNIPKNFESIKIENIFFRYSIDAPMVLDGVDFEIPRNKVTAIVGASGSGKTTLIKILLSLYKPTQGAVMIGNQNLSTIDLVNWRAICGAVMQDGYIFPDTIAHNISESDSETLDKEKLYESVRIANAESFVTALHAGYNTAIGDHGVLLSQGQKQRILIARAVYKDPQFIFFDEATNSLDSTNELEIMKNLKNYSKDRTVIIVAHRLSTVKNADQIIVLDKGRVAEKGTHKDLIAKQDFYYKLVSNQLEIEGIS
jgi:ATP-binding cassette subfamily B protein